MDLARETFKISKGSNIDRASCSLCHALSGPPAWNPFGREVHFALDARHTHNLDSEILRSILKNDSDGDGYTNGEELATDSLPGDPSSHPSKHLLSGAEPPFPQATAPHQSSEAPNPFSPTAILLAKNAQHPVLVHFPIALFIVSLGLDIFGARRKNPAWVAAARVNLQIAGVAALFTIVTGILAWQFKFDGSALTGYLLLHLILGVISTLIVWTLLWIRRTEAPGRLYFAVAAIGFASIVATGHLGGVLSGVAN